VVEQGFGGPVGEVEQVLHRRDLDDLACLFELVDLDLRQADVADLALVLQQFQLADLVGQGDLRVDAVELEQLDAFQAHVAQAHLRLLAQVLGPAQRPPVARARPAQARLGSDHQVVRVRVERLLDQLFGHDRPVRVGGVDEVDAQLDRAPQHAYGLLGVLRVTPDTGPGELHRAVAEPGHRYLAAEHELARRPRVGSQRPPPFPAGATGLRGEAGPSTVCPGHRPYMPGEPARTRSCRVRHPLSARCCVTMLQLTVSPSFGVLLPG
jgi:hypothetical protein